MTKRGRGRPRTFEESDVLDAVIDPFWRQGLDATSLDDLAEAAGLNRPSLYAAFGDKLALYVRALRHFGLAIARDAGTALEKSQDLESALRAFYKAALDIYFGPPGPARGCFILTTAAADAHEHEAVREVLESVLAEIDSTLADRIAKAPEAKSASPKRVAELAKIATGMLVGIATRARVGEKRAALDAVARTGAAMIARAARDPG